VPAHGAPGCVRDAAGTARHLPALAVAEPGRPTATDHRQRPHRARGLRGARGDVRRGHGAAAHRPRGAAGPGARGVRGPGGRRRRGQVAIRVREG
jgi:hypothetical protein